MKVKCSEHGVVAGVAVTRDLWEAMRERKTSVKVVTVAFAFEGSIVQLFHLSNHLASKHDVVDGTIFEIPEQYPDWKSQETPCCEICFRSFLEMLGESFRLNRSIWNSDE